jgi:hypothetical protein
MDKIKQVITILESANFIPIVKTESFNDISWNQIVWTDKNGDECSIFEDNIATDNFRVAWFQSSQRDNHILRVYENSNEFTWTPITYNPVFGCNCILLEWYKNHLIFIYQEKHDIYICSIKDFVVKHFNFHGEEIERKNDIISYDTYMNKLNDKVRLIKIPELEELEAIDKVEAEKEGLLPMGLNRVGNFLANK